MLYSPGGGMARELAKNPTVLLVNDILFAHGGVLPPHGELTELRPCSGHVRGVLLTALCPLLGAPLSPAHLQVVCAPACHCRQGLAADRPCLSACCFVQS